MAYQAFYTASGPLAVSDLRSYLWYRLSEMQLDRTQFLPRYWELARYFRPNLSRYSTDEQYRGPADWSSIINNTGTRALRTASAGLLSGVMSPSRPWFELRTFDPDLREDRRTKEYLHTVRNLLLKICNRSNLYGMASTFMTELLLFGTALMTHDEDYDDVATFSTYTAGSYMVSQDYKGDTTTFIRECQMTVAQLVQQFGMDNVSSWTRSLYEDGRRQLWIKVYHIVEPNSDAGEQIVPKRFPYRSIYFEAQGTGVESQGTRGERRLNVLSARGYHEFPAYAVRWEVTNEDVYGTNSPGMVALGDTKALQEEEVRKAQGIQKQVAPPLHGPPSLKNAKVATMPNGLTIYDDPTSAGGQGGLRAVYEVKPDVQALMLDINSVQRRIEDSFFVNLFLAITNMEGIQPRNELEINERNAERLLQLGPVLEHLHRDFLTRLITRLFNQATRNELLPPPPPQLEGQSVEPWYISSLARAQRAVAAQPIENIANFVAAMKQVDMTDGKKFNSDQAIDEYADALGSPPGVIVPDQEVQKQRKAEQEMAQRAQQAEISQMETASAKSLAEAQAASSAPLTGAFE